MRFILYYSAFFQLFISIVLTHHINTEQLRKKIHFRTNEEPLKYQHRFIVKRERNVNYTGGRTFGNTYGDSHSALSTLIRGKRSWGFWWKKYPSTKATSTTTIKTTTSPIQTASEKKGLTSWLSRAASKVKEAVAKGASDVKESIKTLGRKIKKHFTKSDDNFHVFVNKVKEQVNQGDKDALDLLNKLGIDVKYDKAGQPVGSIVSKDAGNVTDILINEGYYNPGNITTYSQPDKNGIVFPSNTVTRRPPLVTQKIISTKLPIFDTTHSVIDAARSPMTLPTVKAFYNVTDRTNSVVEKVIAVTSLPNTAKTSENVTKVYETEVPTAVFPSVINVSTDSFLPNESLSPSSTTKEPVVNLSSSILATNTFPITKGIFSLRYPLTSNSKNTSTPTVIATSKSTPTTAMSITSRIATSAQTYATFKTITTEETSFTMTTPATTAITTKTTPTTTTTLNATSVTQMFTATSPYITTTPTTTKSTTSKITTTTTTTTPTHPTTFTTATPTTTNHTTAAITTTPTTATTTPTTTTTTTPTTTTTTTPTTTTTTTPTTTTTTTPTTTTTTITTTSPTTTTTTTKITSPSTTKRTTTTTTKKTTTTEAPFPPPFPDIFKDSAVRDRLHELFINGDFSHDDLKKTFDFDPAKYDDYNY